MVPHSNGTAFALLAGMTKQNNNNPGNYKDGGRNHQGEGIPQEQNREVMNKDLKSHGKDKQAPDVPGAKSKK
jgi:hypothetical protein